MKMANKSVVAAPVPTTARIMEEVSSLSRCDLSFLANSPLATSIQVGGFPCPTVGGSYLRFLSDVSGKDAGDDSMTGTASKVGTEVYSQVERAKPELVAMMLLG